MADAWGGSWGTSWGVSWGAGVVPPDPDVEIIDVDGLRKRDRAADEFEATKKASREALRAAIERAFEGPQPVVADTAVVQPERREIARQVLADIRLDGLTASLGRIEKLIRDYEEELEIEEEEAIVALLS